ncbi:jg8090 [Pararge aegeria aegeria]|uniref:Jg8090 protein n=1 Tax=Pararge aegeria aegeria TaxID=348720 RepID=A0A8S4SBU3_9NEOP|nr:jg8090 [Pararge aegeria aegeria]
MGLTRRLRVTQRVMERAMLGVSLRDKIRNVEIRRRKAEVAMGGAHSSKEGWTLGSQGAGMSAPHWPNTSTFETSSLSVCSDSTTGSEGRFYREEAGKKLSSCSFYHSRNRSSLTNTLRCTQNRLCGIVLNNLIFKNIYPFVKIMKPSSYKAQNDGMTHVLQKSAFKWVSYEY